MMDLQTIKTINEERARESRENNFQPFLIESKEQIESFNGFPFAVSTPLTNNVARCLNPLLVLSTLQTIFK